MNMKILAVLFVMGSANAFAVDYCAYVQMNYQITKRNALKTQAEKTEFDGDKAAAEVECKKQQAKDAETTQANAKSEAEKKQQAQSSQAMANADAGPASADECEKLFEEINAMVEPEKQALKKQRMAAKKYQQCSHLRVLSIVGAEKDKIEAYGRKDTTKASPDGKIQCSMPYSFTADYEACEKAITAYSSILAADAALNLTQQVRTDNKNANINEEAAKQAASGNIQGAAFDAGIESNKHMKSMEAEKVAAYTMAVGALTMVHKNFPDEEDVADECVAKKAKTSKDQEIQKAGLKFDVKKNTCMEVIKNNKRGVLANAGVKGALVQIITEFISKGIAAGIKMSQYKTTADAIATAQEAIVEDPGTDMMLELCQANPADPACLQTGNRVSGTGSYAGGDFSLGGDGSNNVFGPAPGTGEFGEVGAETNLDDKNSVSSVNSPFADEAKKAKGILGPAGAAQSQAGGAPAGAGGPGGGAAMGGASASLGGDLNGADPAANKDPQIKTGNISGSYNYGSGGGFKGVSKGKDDANPFASLFDQKGGGGVEEDRSIASGDIDGKASGLFEKISKRYGQVQADKRVEAKNLE